MIITLVEKWNCLAATALRDAAALIEQASPPTLVGEAHIAFGRLAEDADATIKAVTSGMGSDRAIYIIALDDEADSANFRLAFEQAREDRRDELWLPQANLVTDESTGSRIVYVGSSCATSKTRKRTTAARLRQHLVKAPTGTYALALSMWAGSLKGGIRVQVYNYPEDTDRAVVITVEDRLSQDLKPMCGRRGIAR